MADDERTQTLHEIELRTPHPDKIPKEEAEKMLASINDMATAADLLLAVELLGEPEPGLKLAQSILDARDTQKGFSTVQQVYDVEGLDPERFGELCVALGQEPQPYVPDLWQGSEQPTAPRPSASETVLKFGYRVLKKGPLYGLEGEILTLPNSPRYCTACAVFAPSFNEEIQIPESQVQITALILGAEDDNFVFSITMDQRMRPYDWMHPLDKTAKEFQFPAIMQLNNSMIIKTKIKATGQIMTLVSRDVPCQVGRITGWPPYGMTLLTQREILYHDSEDPLGDPVLLITSGTTYLFEKDTFFSRRVDIKSYKFVPGEGDRGLSAVLLSWDDPPPEGPCKTDHYHVYRTRDPSKGEHSWMNVSGHVKGGSWIDPNPPAGPNYYRIVPVLLTILGDDYEGFPGQMLRVEPAQSVFRV